MFDSRGVSRRDFFRTTALSLLGAGLGAQSCAVTAKAGSAGVAAPGAGAPSSLNNSPLGPLDPHGFLEAFELGRVSALPDGRTLREYDLVALDRTIEVARGVLFPAWTFNGGVPGPTLRATEGDLVRIRFRNESAMSHTVHFHGFHAANMDGTFEIVDRGQEYTYEFTAEPFGLHLYHCHVIPLRMHIARGLYGAFIVDPKPLRPPMREMVMVMNGYDTDFDHENELYSVNGVANCYAERPIRLQLGEWVRIYLVNLTEHDPINSMHIHANFFHVYKTGTSLTPTEFTDTIMLCQGERAILEFAYRHPGKFMFHAHQSEFAELGWMGFFRVREGPA